MPVLCFIKCIVYAKEIIVEIILKPKSFIILHCLLRILNIKSTGTESYSITPFQVDTLYHILAYLFNHYLIIIKQEHSLMPYEKSKYIKEHVKTK